MTHERRRAIRIVAHASIVAFNIAAIGRWSGHSDDTLSWWFMMSANWVSLVVNFVNLCVLFVDVVND